jgi:hypothetical protein
MKIDLITIEDAPAGKKYTSRVAILIFLSAINRQALQFFRTTSVNPSSRRSSRTGKICGNTCAKATGLPVR